MGLLYIHASVKKSRHESIFIDANVEGYDHAKAAKMALVHNPDLIGIQAMTFTMPDAYMLAKAIKSINSDVDIVIGGPHATIFPEETAALEFVDYAFAGEGEIDFINFLDAYSNQKECLRAPGIAHKFNSGVIYTPSSGLLKDLDSIPFPAREDAPHKKYCSIISSNRAITVMITSRGCPFSCIFCNRMGRKYRCHSAEYVLKEIESVVRLGIAEIFIHDDTFTLNRERVVAICRGIIERKYDIVWEARTRVDCVDDDLISLMKRAGCRRLSFGVESGSPEVLSAMQKKIELSRVIDVFKSCRREGIVSLADFMIGSMNETRKDIETTLKLVECIKPDYVQYSICSPYPGTPLYQIGRENGLLRDDVWRDFAKDPLKKFVGPVWTQNFSERELVDITAVAYREFYMRPSYMIRQIRNIRTLKQLRGMVTAAVGMLKNH